MLSIPVEIEKRLHHSLFVGFVKLGNGLGYGFLFHGPTQSSFTNISTRISLSIALVIGGWAAFQFRKRQRRAYALVEIIFAIAANWVSLNKLGVDLHNEKQQHNQVATYLDQNRQDLVSMKSDLSELRKAVKESSTELQRLKISLERPREGSQGDDSLPPDLNPRVAAKSADNPSPTMEDNPSNPPSSSPGLLIAVVLGAGLYLVARGLITLNDSSSQILLSEIERIGKLVAELASA